MPSSTTRRWQILRLEQAPQLQLQPPPLPRLLQQMLLPLLLFLLLLPPPAMKLGLSKFIIACILERKIRSKSKRLRRNPMS